MTVNVHVNDTLSKFLSKMRKIAFQKMFIRETLIKCFYLYLIFNGTTEGHDTVLDYFYMVFRGGVNTSLYHQF